MKVMHLSMSVDVVVVVVLGGGEGVYTNIYLPT